MDRKLYGKKSKPIGITPSVILENTKFDHNLGAVVRAASCFGVDQVFYTGDRINLGKKKRLPREERMKGYKHVELVQFDYPFDVFEKDVTFIGVELMPDTIPIPSLYHPRNAVYVFGPEDGGLSKSFRSHCHMFVHIPSYHCLNLAAAVYVTLYDRQVNLYERGIIDRLFNLREERGF